MLFSAVAVSWLLAASASARLGGYEVLTSSGPVIGHAANASGVAEYLGIPYAKPPVWSLRFAPPKRYIGNITFVASQYGFTYPQTAAARVNYPDRTPQAQRIVANFAGQLNHTQSEDCLTLNVWSRPESNNLKPVLVFIHGGRFTISESNTLQEAIPEAGYYRWAAYGAGSILSDAQWDYFNLVTFTCPSTYGVAARARFGVSSWLFRYGGDWDIVRLYPNSSAYHGTDMHMVFGNSAKVSGLPDEESQAQLEKVVMHAWATFASDPQIGLEKLGWSQYHNGTDYISYILMQHSLSHIWADTLVELGFNKSSVPAFVSPNK